MEMNVTLCRDLRLTAIALGVLLALSPAAHAADDDHGQSATEQAC